MAEVEARAFTDLYPTRGYNRVMSPARDRLRALVDALPDHEVAVAISFLTELGEEEVVDPETAAKLDDARAEPGDDVPLEDLRHRRGS